MARKKKHEEHENHERWLISYADFITLLFAFFVVMYAVSSVNEGKYRVLSESLVAAFRSPTKSILPVQVGAVAKSPYQDQLDFRQSPVAIQLPDLPMPRYDEAQLEQNAGARQPPAPARGDERSAAEGNDPRAAEADDPRTGEDGDSSWQKEMILAQQTLATISAEIEQAMGEMIEKGLITVRRSKHWVEVEINTSILFPSGSATLSAGARKILRELAAILEKFPNAVHVEGFTDSVPINNVIFPSNWELSAGRAASVVHLFTDAGLEPQRLVAIGYAQYRPVADNDDSEGRAKNRRVVLVIQSTADTGLLAKALAEYERMRNPAQAPAAAVANLLSEHGELLQSDAASPAPPEAEPARVLVHRPTNPGALRLPGKFPVITPPIQLPIERAVQTPVQPSIVPEIAP